MERRKLVVGNWKMHGTHAATRTWCSKLQELIESGGFDVRAAATSVAVAPPFTAIDTLEKQLDGLGVLTAAQNCHFEPDGAYTGETSIEMLIELGCNLVIVGHSERRQLFGETDALIRRKVGAAVTSGLTPILCVGETEIQRESGRMETIIEAQLRNGLGLVSPLDPAAIVVAYEPVWAIGTGRVATPAQAQEAHRFLRGILASIAGAERAAGVSMLYGGSVNPANAGD
ncbi:MAG: triose-phosphate isomerase, partial [Acidobacteriota bacterium]|nr:triose-phosphate isomerase [Acidobacteriota bacterium]